MVATLVENTVHEHGNVSLQDDECFRDVAGLAYLSQYLVRSLIAPRG